MAFPGDLFSVPRRGMTPPPVASLDTPREPGFRWIPIRSLAERHRARILSHLMALNESDRYLRFGYSATDEQVRHYVERIDFARDEVFGIFNRKLELIALAHLAYLPGAADGMASAEFGVSVDQKARGRGYGSRLFDHAVLHARNRGVDTLVIHALSENRVMLRIARNAGATVHRQGAEAEAVLKLPPEDLNSRMEQLMEDGAAEIDYQLKVQARRMDAWMDVVLEVKQRLGRSGRNAES